MTNICIIGYTLDCLKDFFGVFFSKEDESKKLLVHKRMIKVPLHEGYIVEIDILDEGYEINDLKDEKEDARNKVNSLLGRLEYMKY